MDAADLSAEATGKDRADAGDGSQLSNNRVVFEFDGDPVLDLLELGFEEADVFEGGQVERGIGRVGNSPGQLAEACARC